MSRRRRDHADRQARPGRLLYKKFFFITVRQAIGWVAVYVSLAAACGLAIGVTAGWVTAGQFYVGYLTEYSLSLDNLFVFAVIMTWFAVPPQPRVLLFGIGLALAMRSALSSPGGGAEPLRLAVLTRSAGSFCGPRRPDPRRPGPGRTPGRQHAGRRRGSGGERATAAGPARCCYFWWWRSGWPTWLFAFDSIPAVFGITTSAALVASCTRSR